MKTAESAFAGFRKCEFTTLAEATDRILATSLDAEWEYAGEIDDLDSVVIDLMLDVFAGTHSTSVQRTLFRMGEAALRTFPGLDSHRSKPIEQTLSEYRSLKAGPAR